MIGLPKPALGGHPRLADLAQKLPEIEGVPSVVEALVERFCTVVRERGRRRRTPSAVRAGAPCEDMPPRFAAFEATGAGPHGRELAHRSLRGVRDGGAVNRAQGLPLRQGKGRDRGIRLVARGATAGGYAEPHPGRRYRAHQTAGDDPGAEQALGRAAGEVVRFLRPGRCRLSTKTHRLKLLSEVLLRAKAPIGASSSDA